MYNAQHYRETLTQEVVQLRKRGLTLQSICDILNKQSYTTINGKKLTPQNIRVYLDK